MANPERGEVSLTRKTDGKSFTLRPSLNALCVCEERMGKSTADLMVAASIGNMTATRAILWSYLQKYHAKEFDTFEQVGQLVDDIGLDEINAQLSKLMELNQPPKDAVAEPSRPQ